MGKTTKAKKVTVKTTRQALMQATAAMEEFTRAIEGWSDYGVDNALTTAEEALTYAPTRDDVVECGDAARSARLLDAMGELEEALMDVESVESEARHLVRQITSAIGQIHTLAKAAKATEKKRGIK